MWSVYILECNDGSYYTGITRDLKTRLKDHNKGRAASYTKIKRPLKLRYIEEYNNRFNAAQRELEIKKLHKIEKRHLIRFGLGKRFN